MNHWIDPTFDPLQDLRTAQEQIHHLEMAVGRLIYGHNNHEASLVETTRQQTEIIKLLKQTQHELMNIKLELEWLKLQRLNTKPS